MDIGERDSGRGERTLKRYSRMISYSALVSSTIRFVKPLFTKTLFQPVTASVSVNFYIKLSEKRIEAMTLDKLTVCTNDRMNSL